MQIFRISSWWFCAKRYPPKTSCSSYALFTVVSNSYAKITGGEVAEKGGNPEMEVAGLDICVSVCSRIKNPNLAKKTTPHK